jgi:glutathione synthase
MMRAAQKRGHAVWLCEQEHLHWRNNLVQAHATRVSLTDNDEDWYRPHETLVEQLKAFGAVLMR